MSTILKEAGISLPGEFSVRRRLHEWKPDVVMNNTPELAGDRAESLLAQTNWTQLQDQGRHYPGAKVELDHEAGILKITRNDGFVVERYGREGRLISFETASANIISLFTYQYDAADGRLVSVTREDYDRATYDLKASKQTHYLCQRVGARVCLTHFVTHETLQNQAGSQPGITRIVEVTPPQERSPLQWEQQF